MRICSQDLPAVRERPTAGGQLFIGRPSLNRRVGVLSLGARPSVSVQNQVRAKKEERTMKNVEMTVEGTLLTIKVDLSKEFGPSASGRRSSSRPLRAM